MRAPQLGKLAALALAGTLLGGVLSGCGKGQSATTSASGQSARTAPAAHGVVGVSTKNTTRLGGTDSAGDAAAVAQAVYPGLTPASRPQAVLLVDEHDWPAALAASALAGAPLGAPLLYAEGDKLPASSEQALSAMRPIGAHALGGAAVIRIATHASLPDAHRTLDVPAIADPARMAAAVLEVLDTVRGSSSHEVIVVAAEAPQALQMPAAGLAAESGAPILFVTREGVPPATSAALKSLEHPTIYVVAPTTLGTGAYAGLAKLGTVVHVSGAAGSGESASADPVQNAIAVSRFSRGIFGWGIHEAGHGLVFANLTRPLDGPAAAPLSAHGDYGPLLLLEDRASVPTALTHYLSDIEPGYTAAIPPVREVYNHGWLIGEEDAISALAQAELDAVLEIAPRQASGAEQSVAEAE